MRAFVCLAVLIAAPAQAAPNAPKVIPRAQWDPTPPRLRGMTKHLRALKWIVVHHSDFPGQPGPLAIKNYHRRVSGFADIGYHFVVGRDGTVYEARALRWMGAHAGVTWEGIRTKPRWKGRRLDPDYGAIGIVLDGNFMRRAPPRAQRDSLQRLVTWLRTKHRIAADHVITHREVKARIVEARGLTFKGRETVCPGDVLHSAVVRLRRRLD